MLHEIGCFNSLRLRFHYKMQNASRVRDQVETLVIHEKKKEIYISTPSRAVRSGRLGRNFTTKLLLIRYLFIFWFHCENIQYNLTLKRKKQENTEQMRSLVVIFLPNLPLRTARVRRRYRYIYVFLSFFRELRVIPLEDALKTHFASCNGNAA